MPLEGAQLLGGRHDGKPVGYAGPELEHEGQLYLAFVTPGGRVFYLLASFVRAWFALG